MNKKRIAAIVLIALILIVFILMAVSLIQGKNSLFFYEGSVLVALFIIAFALTGAIKKKRGLEEASEEKKEADA